MAIRNVNAVWQGTLKEGKGEMSFTGYTGPFTFASRFENETGTNPEELVGAAIAGCYSMFLSALISKEELTPTRIQTSATVHLERDDQGPVITKIELVCEASVPGLSQEKFKEVAAAAKANCPISRLYAGTTITLEAKLS